MNGEKQEFFMFFLRCHNAVSCSTADEKHVPALLLIRIAQITKQIQFYYFIVKK